MERTPIALSPDTALPSPDEFLTGPRGQRVKAKHISPSALLQDQIVTVLHRRAHELNALLAQFRADTFEEVDTYLAILSEKFGAKPRNASNATLTDFAELSRVEVSTGNFLSLGPELQAAKTLIDECLERWSENANENLRAIVNDAFDVGSEGRVKVDRVLALRRVQIEDETWKRAMDAITEAIKVTRSKRYVRFHFRENMDAKWQQIPLDLARV